MYRKKPRFYETSLSDLVNNRILKPENLHLNGAIFWFDVRNTLINHTQTAMKSK